MLEYRAREEVVKKGIIRMEVKKKYYISLFENTDPNGKFLYTSCAHETLEDLEFVDPSDREGFIKIIEIEV